MKILSFDVESNGLHGEAFAVAGVLMDPEHQILDQFVSRCPIVAPVDAWVATNVLGPMAEIAESTPDARAMRNLFWAWYKRVKDSADLIVAANPYPVEARFLIKCQEDDLAARELDHPFPYYDLSSLLYALGITSSEARHDYVAAAARGASGEPHNPLWDARATAMAALKIAGSAPSAASQPPASQSN